MPALTRRRAARLSAARPGNNSIASCQGKSVKIRHCRATVNQRERKNRVVSRMTWFLVCISTRCRENRVNVLRGPNLSQQGRHHEQAFYFRCCRERTRRTCPCVESLVGSGPGHRQSERHAGRRLACGAAHRWADPQRPIRLRRLRVDARRADGPAGGRYPRAQAGRHCVGDAGEHQELRLQLPEHGSRRRRMGRFGREGARCRASRRQERQQFWRR